MKKIILALLLVAILLPSFVAAKELEISLSTGGIVTYTEKTISVDLTIQNNQNKEDSFSITIWPPSAEGINAILEKYTTTLSAGGSETEKIYFDVAVSAEEKISIFTITVTSRTDSSINASENLNLRVVRTSPIYISDLKLSKYVFNPGEELDVNVSVANKGTETYEGAELKTSVQRYGQIIQKFEDDLNVEKSAVKKIGHAFAFDKYADPGTYTLNVELRDSTDKLVGFESVSLQLNAVANVTHEKTVQYGLLLQTVTVKVKNEGNVESTGFYVTEDIPSFMKTFFYPVGKWTEEQIYDRILYHWYVPSLLPGEERTIKYEVNLWYGTVVSVIIIFCVVMAFRYVFTPQIVKRHRLVGEITRENEITISLDVKNRSRHEVKSVIVRDIVPPILKVVKKFETLKPAIRITAAGTELIWKLASMKPREERILTYAVTPVVDMSGSLKLPKASITYLDRKKATKSAASKTVLVKSM